MNRLRRFFHSCTITATAEDGDTWTCPTCGTTWRFQYVPTQIGAEAWLPDPDTGIFDWVRQGQGDDGA